MESKDLFHQLRPCCVSIAKDPSYENLQAAYAVLEQLPNGAISELVLFEYVLFPFKLTLQKQSVLKENHKILCFQCINCILKEPEKPNTVP